MLAETRLELSGSLSCGGSIMEVSAGMKARPRASVMPMRSDPTSAPRTEPTPPTTITTKVVMRMRSPMPISTASSGAAMTPAKPHSVAPSTKTRVKSRWILMPSASTISPSSAPARTSMPTRVREISHHRPTATSTPAPMSARRMTG